MWEALLAQYTIKEIIIGVIMLAVAFKSSFDFFDWVKLKYKEKFDKDYQKKVDETLSKEHYESCQKRFQESIDAYNNMDKKLDALTEQMNTRFGIIESSIKRLTDSDMHDIKSWIVEKHHKLVEQQWVDDFTMDTIERRYADYKAEGGNSYVKTLMEEIRSLPHQRDKEGED